MLLREMGEVSLAKKDPQGSLVSFRKAARFSKRKRTAEKVIFFDSVILLARRTGIPVGWHKGMGRGRTLPSKALPCKPKETCQRCSGKALLNNFSE